MNKKFSTLVAMLLASGGLFYAVDAMVLPGSEGVAKYVTAVARTTEAGEFTGYSFATEKFDAKTSCIWKMVAATGNGSKYNLTASAEGKAPYYLASVGGQLVMQATAEGALPFALDGTTGKLSVEGIGNVLSIKDGVLSLEPQGSEIPAAGLFTSATAAVTEANVTDALALGAIVPTKNVVDLTTNSLVLNWKAAVEGKKASFEGTTVAAADFAEAPTVEFAKSGVKGDENIYIKFSDGQFLLKDGSTNLSIGKIDGQNNNSAITIESNQVKIGDTYFLNLTSTELTAVATTAGSEPVSATEALAAKSELLTTAEEKAKVYLFNGTNEEMESASVLTFTPKVEAEPAALDGLKKLADTNLSNAGQGKWSIEDGKIKADENALLTEAVNATPTLGAGTNIFLETDGAVRLGQSWLKITSDGIVCSTTEPAAAEKVYLYSGVGDVVKATDAASNLVISTLTTTDGKSENVSGTVATVAVKLATPADNLPGLDNVTVETDGKVSAIGAGVSTVPAPFYFKDGNTYLSVTYKDGKFILAEGKEAITAEPTGAQSAAASWKLEGGKLISVAADRAGKPVALATSTTKAATTYVVVPVNNAPTVTLGNTGAVTFAKGGTTEPTTANLYVSATSIDVNEDRVTTNGGIVIGGTQKLSYQKLLTSVPSGYAIIGVSQTNGTMEYLYTDADGKVTTEKFISTNDYRGYLWKVSETNDNKKVYYYQFTSLRKNAAGDAIQWIIDGRAQFTGGAQYGGNGFTLSHPSGNIVEDGTADPNGTNVVIGFYEAPLGAFTKDALNDILKPGFEMSVEIEKDSKDKLENIDIFSGKMYPKETASGSNTYVLWDNAKNADDETDNDDATAKMLVLNKSKISGDNVVGAFAWITNKEYEKDKANYETNFQFLYDLSTPSTDVVSKVTVGYYTLSVLEVNKKFYLTSVEKVTDETKLPYIKLGADNIYPVKNLLGKLWNISYADTKANAKADGEEYKLNGILAVTYDKDGVHYVWNEDSKAWEKDVKDPTSVADYVASSTVAESAPEAQWMVTSANLNTNTFTLTNRENPDVEITGVTLRLRDGNKFEVYIDPTANNTNGKLFSTSEKNLKGIKNDIVYLTESVKKDNFQGYMQTTENTLRSNNYFLGQYHAIDGNHNAYLVENHKNSHQIGAVADQEAADKWKLHFAMKLDDDNKYTEVDTVYVINEYATLNADKNGFLPKGHKDAKKDTLAILPYAFQKVANREFVKFDDRTNFNFYACDETNKNDANDAVRFALKVKPNGYNFVEIKEDGTFSAKAYLANSANKGSLERMETYAADNNSVMVVEAADASEYHKIAQAWGDTIKLFRDENNAQVMFEKFDAKSVVAPKDTLSFLNIDNVNQFNVNPAIFADTAYINRWDADGVLNTTYQYLLTLNPSFGLHTEDCEIPGHEPIVGGIDTVYGRFLVNLIDTANVYGVNHIHNNWYINESEAGEKLAKLSFVEGYHTNDTLYLTRQGGEIVKIGMTDPAFNVAKFAFRYVNSDAKTFKIQTQFKEYLGDEKKYDSAEEFARAYADPKNDYVVSNEGYLKWINGTVVVTEGYENGDVFGIEENYAGNPTANENVTVSGISVEATNGAVIIKGAEGKKVSIVNVLGQTVANAVITSSEATIAAPAGVVVVAVEGEAAVKAIVK